MSFRALEETKRLLQSEFKREEQRLQTAIHSALTETEDEEKGKDLPKLKEESIEYKPMDVKPRVVAEDDRPQEKSDSKPMRTVERPGMKSESGLNAEEIRKRSEYLRKQRDKLLKIKKEKRDRQITRLQQKELIICYYSRGRE